MGSVKTSTKEKILVASEGLLAEHGFDGVSLRDITHTAGVNVASVSYHFGNKEKLFEAVKCRYMNPINEERVRLLECLTEGGRVANVRDILDAFMRPFFTVMSQSELKEVMFLKLIGRCLKGQYKGFPEGAEPLVEEMIRVFTVAIEQALPDLPLNQIIWRLHYTFGVMMNTMIYADTTQNLTNGDCGNPNAETQLDRMIDFCHAGFINAEGRVRG